MSTPETSKPIVQEMGEMLEILGVASYGAALPDGKIHWNNAKGEMIANADCKVILSFAATNNSIAWGSAIPGFKDAKVPVIPTPEGNKPIAMDYHEPQARHLARKAAAENDAEFMYCAVTGGGGFLYLAIYNFHLGKVELSKDDIKKRTDSVKHFNREMAENLLDVLDRKAFGEMVILIMAWKDKLNNQKLYVVKDLPISKEVDGLLSRIDNYLEMAKAEKKGIAKVLEEESELWW